MTRAPAGATMAAKGVILVGLPLQLARVLTGPVTQLMWIPVAVFELVVAVWLMVKGAALPRGRSAAISHH